MPTFANSLYRESTPTNPNLPKSIEGVTLEGPWTQTKNGDNFILANDGSSDRILLIGTDDNLRKLFAAQKVFCDGTFYSSSRFFKQIYTLHGFVDGQMFPLVFALLTYKSQATYNRMFRLLKEAAEVRGLLLNPPAIQPDFETAVHNAASEIFPNVILKGCFVHYGQCIWRKSQNLGLSATYQTDEDSYRSVRRAAALPLVSRYIVEDVWFEALEDAPESPALRLFADYVTETCLEGNFPAAMCNHYETEGARTANHLEGWHSKLNKLTKKAHPDLFEIMNVFKTEQAANEVKQLQLEVDARLCKLKANLVSGEKTVMQYLDAVACLISI